MSKSKRQKVQEEDVEAEVGKEEEKETVMEFPHPFQAPTGKNVIEYPFRFLVGEQVVVEIVNPCNGVVFASVKGRLTTISRDDEDEDWDEDDEEDDDWVASIMENPSPGIIRQYITGKDAVRARLDVRSPVLTPIYGGGYMTPEEVYGIRINGKYAVGRLDAKVMELMLKEEKKKK